MKNIFILFVSFLPPMILPCQAHSASTNTIAENPNVISNESWKVFRNEKFGFEFKYPSKYEVKMNVSGNGQPLPNEMYINSASGWAEVDAEDWTKENRSHWTVSQFAALAKHRALVSCLADGGSNGGERCEMTQQSSLPNPYGMKGFRIDRDLVSLQDEEAREKTNPVYVVDISANDSIWLLVFDYIPGRSKIPIDDLEKIAMTVRRLPSARAIPEEP